MPFVVNKKTINHSGGLRSPGLSWCIISPELITFDFDEKVIWKCAIKKNITGTANHDQSGPAKVHPERKRTAPFVFYEYKKGAA